MIPYFLLNQTFGCISHQPRGIMGNSNAAQAARGLPSIQLVPFRCTELPRLRLQAPMAKKVREDYIRKIKKILQC